MLVMACFKQMVSWLHRLIYSPAGDQTPPSAAIAELHEKEETLFWEPPC